MIFIGLLSHMLPRPEWRLHWSNTVFQPPTPQTAMNCGPVQDIEWNVHTDIVALFVWGFKYCVNESSWFHDDVTKWKHFPRYWPFLAHRSPADAPHKGQQRGAFSFFYLRLNKRLSKQSRRWWFETPSHSLLRHCNALSIYSWLLRCHSGNRNIVQISKEILRSK